MFKSNGRPRRPGSGPAPRVERPSREAVTKSATINVDGASRIFPCTVRDISVTGARVSISNPAAVPETMLLTMRSENKVARGRVVWRKVNEIGVQFLRVAGMEQEERMRREQAAAYQKAQNALLLQRQQEAERQRLYAEQKAALSRQAQYECLRLMALLNMDPDEGLTEETLKRTYRKEAMARHPDQGGSMEAFQELNQIYKALMTAVMEGNAPPPGARLDVPVAQPAPPPQQHPSPEQMQQPAPAAAHHQPAAYPAPPVHAQPAQATAPGMETPATPITPGLPKRAPAPRPASELSPLDAFHTGRTV